MLFVRRVPAPPLDAFVESIWYCQHEPRPFALERILPHGFAQLTINLQEDQTREYHPLSGQRITSSGTILSGVSSRYCVIDTAEQECAAGVTFRPGGTIPFVRIPPAELRDSPAPLEFAWGRQRTAELREQLLAAPTPAARIEALERALRQAWNAREPDRTVAFALDEFTRRPEMASIAAVTGRAGLSQKRFIERFKASVGLAPKRYCRLLRFQAALKAAERGRCVDWTRIALDCGYFDQAHFIHEFRAFSGITPTGYDASRTRFRNHVNFLQSDPASSVRG